MKQEESIKLRKLELSKLSKETLINLIIELECRFEKDSKISETQIKELSKELEALKEKERNLKANQPSSKKPEWDKEGNLIKGNHSKRKVKSRKKKSGCGNKTKFSLTPNQSNFIELDACPDCGNSLKKKQGKQNPPRIVEDIVPPPVEPIILEEITESKWCECCKKMVSSKSENALPGSDIGLNSTIEIVHLSVMTSLSMPNIQAYFRDFKSFKVSTAGISKMMIRLANIMQPVYEEIANDVKAGSIVWADETGWRTKGLLAWLWVFANKRSAYYWADKNRTGSVVEKTLGSMFCGLLTTDGWGAYNILECFRQTCMPHIYRKIRVFIDDYPKLRSVLQLYLRLRQIIRKGENLQLKRTALTQAIFQSKLKKLENDLNELLNWKNPNPILQKAIKIITRQKGTILTFISHDGAESNNNFSERMIKKGVLKRKISGGSKSEEGFRAYACLQSIAMTCQLRKFSFSDFMKKSLKNYIRTGKPLQLAEYETLINKASNFVA